MTLDTTVTKRRKRSAEAFNRAKLEASIYAACLSVGSLDGLAKDTASSVCNSVVQWLKDKPDVTSADIRRRAAKALAVLHTDAAYLYEQNKQIM